MNQHQSNTTKKTYTSSWLNGKISINCQNVNVIYYRLLFVASLPTGFFIWGYMYPFTFIFGGAISNSSFGGTKKINCIFSTQGRAPCCFFLNIMQSWRRLFFSVWHWVRQEVGFCLTHGLCVFPTIFFVILYITCQILFFIQNWMQDYLYIVMIN